MIVIVNDWVAATALASVIETVKVDVVAAEPMVPEMTPVVGLRVRPVGRAPEEIDHEPKGVVPPETLTVWE